MSWGGTLGKRATKIWKGRGHNFPKSPTFGYFEFLSFPQATLSIPVKEVFALGWNVYTDQAKGDGTHSCHRHQPLWAVSSPHPHPLISWATSPGLTWFCLYLERGKTQREVPPEKPSPRAHSPLSRKNLSDLDQSPSPRKVTEWGLNDGAWLGWKPNADRHSSRPSPGRSKGHDRQWWWWRWWWVQAAFKPSKV